MNRFYVYILWRPDKVDPHFPSEYAPFYVGKGHNNRIYDHRRQAQWKSVKSNIKNRIIKKLWNQGLDFIEEIILDNLSNQEALQCEINLISFYGRMNDGSGCLANLTRGGDGVVGLSPSKEIREKLSRMFKGRKGKPHSIESRKKMSETRKGRKHSEETRKKMSEVHKGRIFSEETRHKISEAKKGKPFSEEHRKNIGKTSRGRTPSLETRQKISESVKAFRSKNH